ncbi:MAG: hypothetical protein ACLQBQ_07455 [Smithella sp.]
MIENDSTRNTPSAAGGGRAASSQQSGGDAWGIGSVPVCLRKSEYLTVDITNGQEPNLEELRQRFPRIAIFRLPDLVLFGNHISLYRLDRKLGVKK